MKPAFADVQRDRDGVVGVAEFDTYDDMRTACRKCDDTEFRNNYDKAYVRSVRVHYVLPNLGRLFATLMTKAPLSVHLCNCSRLLFNSSLLI